MDNDFRKSLKNILGLSYKTLNMKLLGNFEYYYDNERLILLTGKRLDEKSHFDEFLELKKETDIFGQKLLYIQAPDYYVNSENEYLREIISEDAEMDEWIRVVQENEIDFIDMRDYVTDEQVYDYRFKTDTHLTTETEWWLLGQIVRKLELEEELLDWDKYEIVHNSFLGNFGNSVGEYYTDLDDFVRLYPMFETNFKKTILDNGQSKVGSFDTTVMNGYARDGDCWTYFVTDYASYGNRAVTYDNLLNSNGINVLYIGDSLGYRAISYLSLFVDSLTILDPRFGGKTSMVFMPDYDYVIYMTQRGLWGNYARQLVTNPDADIREIRKDENMLKVTVENTSDCDWSNSIDVKLSLWIDGKDSARMLIDEGVLVKQGAEYEFSFDLSKLNITESSSYEIRMVQEAYCYFGEKAEINEVIFAEEEE